jgi:hypothetical protein
MFDPASRYHLLALFLRLARVALQPKSRKAAIWKSK